jgi:hypothetical protein
MVTNPKPLAYINLVTGLKVMGRQFRLLGGVKILVDAQLVMVCLRSIVNLEQNANFIYIYLKRIKSLAF